MVERIRRFLIPALGAILCAFTIFEVNFARVTPLSQLAVFAMLGMVLCYLQFPVHKKLEENEARSRLTEPQQRAVLEGRKWRWSGWSDIARRAGMSETHAGSVYRYLCSYAHSGSLSVLQVREAKTREDQLALASTSLELVMVAVAFMIRAYCRMFPKAQAALDADEQGCAAVDLWVEVGSRDWLQKEAVSEAQPD